MLNPFFPPYAPGGAEYSVAEMARLLAARGHRVTILTFDPTGSPRDELREGYRVVWLSSPLGLDGRRVIDRSGFVDSPQATARLIKAAVGLHAEVDLVHAQNTATWGAGVAAGARLGRPVAASVRDPSVLCAPGVCLMDDPDPFPTPCSGLLATWRCSSAYLDRVGSTMPAPHRGVHAFRLWRARTRARRDLRRCDGVIAVSEAMQGQLTRHIGLRSGSLTQVYNPPSEFPAAGFAEDAALLERHGLEAGRYFLVPGKKSLGKGTGIAIAAAASLHESHPAHVLALVGDGSTGTSRPGVRDLPAVPNADLLRLIRHAAAVVVPSLVFEGLNRGMLDAVAAGIPVIASDSGGQREGVVPGESGFLVPKGQVAPLVAALREVATWGLVERARAAEASRDLMRERFSRERVTEAMESVYRDLVAGRAGSPRAKAEWK
jgi:glycosyltransferase involved in cell wall biosynthesis